MNIIKLKLFTNQLLAKKKFYANTLSLAIVNETLNSFEVQIGKTILVFSESDLSSTYHFAINIPYDSINDALIWLKSKTNILKYNGYQIVDFPNWDSKAVYFNDADNNILELIARRILRINSDSDFTSSSFLSVSEIGIPSKNIRSLVDNLMAKCSLSIYKGSDDIFCPIGNKHGLFICIDCNQKKWLPNMTDPVPSKFSVIIRNENNSSFYINYENEMLQIMNIVDH